MRNALWCGPVVQAVLSRAHIPHGCLQPGSRHGCLYGCLEPGSDIVQCMWHWQMHVRVMHVVMLCHCQLYVRLMHVVLPDPAQSPNALRQASQVCCLASLLQAMQRQRMIVRNTLCQPWLTRYSYNVVPAMANTIFAGASMSLLRIHLGVLLV